ncbi:FdhD protein/phenylacetyl-CoA:acceptor oxidoreductase accessory protein [Arboricoccus pini]|uniref:Sulfur carrier protein FdhD n=1 Tax=Arboricoccus pini TaxID=1963835 RepID=A0A212PXV0_9PROT|nr:formate dehydrogenase accessory sulfurtransferase FdhD [Arboricoccus pini]SNB51777.1 FdhD protein/phenylacetyl-CoA:acceptor oxidoreductase accessory protein [Arboricoccus pini]
MNDWVDGDSAAEDPFAGGKALPRRPARLEFPAWRWDGRALAERPELVGEECATALVFNGVNYAVMMMTPADFEDFGLGFALAEAVVGRQQDVLALEVQDVSLGVEVHVTIPEARMSVLEQRQRSMAGGTSCGLCGVIGIERALRPLPTSTRPLPVKASAIARALDELPRMQKLNAGTGALHAAGYALPSGKVLMVREDVGRHNALDKLIGAAAKAGLSPAEGFVVLTSRCSTEMVQKTATAGFSLLAAVSGPTALAIRLAEEAGLTMVGFARRQGFNVYTCPDRVLAG